MFSSAPQQKVLTGKDEELASCQQIIHNLKEKLGVAQLNMSEDNVIALQQVQNDLKPRC